MKKTIIYSTPNCHFCALAKEFFYAKGIEFQEYNVATDMAKRQEMIEISGQMGVPVIQVDDELIVGFNQLKLEEMLGL